MYSGETTVSNDILDNVLKGGDILKIRGLWRQKNETLISGAAVPSASPSPSRESVVKVLESHKHAKFTTKLQDDIAMSQNILSQPNKPKLVIKQLPRLTIRTPKTISNLIASTTSTSSTEVKATSSKSYICRNEEKVSAIPSTINDNRPVAPSPPETREIDAPPAEKRLKLETKTTEASPKAPDLKSNQSNKSDFRIDKSKLVIEQNTVDDCNYLLIKEEPIDWDEYRENPVGGEYQTEITIKPEILFDDMEEDIEDEMPIDEPIYSPLTCELCDEVFAIPADWVRHIEGHAGPDAARRRERRGRKSDDDSDPDNIASLRCDLCSRLFATPAEWVRHIQNTHTETELAISNNSQPPKPRMRSVNTDGTANKVCTVCYKKFPSHASMVIHRRTHTGERPFICRLCNKGFNVKSNLLRHLRTLHDEIISHNIPDVEMALKSECTAMDFMN